MKIIFCAGKYSEVFNANVNIAIKIAGTFQKTGHTSYLVFNDDSISQQIKFTCNEMEAYRIPTNRFYSSIYRHYVSKKNNRFSKKQYAIRYPIQAALYYLLKNDELFSYRAFTDFVNDFCKKNDIDFVVTFVKPFHPMYALITSLGEKIKTAYYQLDPWGMHEISNDTNKNKRISREILAMTNSHHIFTTYELYSQYIADPDYGMLKEKMTPVRFPKLITNNYHEVCKKTEPDDEYHVFYLGTIYDEYRDPKKIIDFIMSSSLNIKLHLIGEIYSESVKNALLEFSDKIILSEQVTSEEASRIMNSDVFLLNINNNISNQSPSKLIDYISTGNPIINCIKLENDRSEDTLSSYEMVFNFYEYELARNNIEQFDSFLKKYKNRKVSRKAILDAYNEYTPEFICDQILQKMK